MFLQCPNHESIQYLSFTFFPLPPPTIHPSPHSHSTPAVSKLFHFPSYIFHYILSSSWCCAFFSLFFWKWIECTRVKAEYNFNGYFARAKAAVGCLIEIFFPTWCEFFFSRWRFSHYRWWTQAVQALPKWLLKVKISCDSWRWPSAASFFYSAAIHFAWVLFLLGLLIKIEKKELKRFACANGTSLL